MPHVKLKVSARRFMPGTTRTEHFLFKDTVEDVVQSKQSLHRTCMSVYGRCTGSLYDKTGRQIGWKFEGKEKDSAGSRFWWETKVVVEEGAVQVGSFKLKEE